MSNVVNSTHPFEVTAYDKDGDVYDTMHVTPSKDMAERIAQSLTKLIRQDKLRRHDSREPYDSVVIWQNGNIVATHA